MQGEGEKEKNGFIAKAWSFLKNTKLLDWCTDSTNDIKKAREKHSKKQTQKEVFDYDWLNEKD